MEIPAFFRMRAYWTAPISIKLIKEVKKSKSKCIVIVCCFQDVCFSFFFQSFVFCFFFWLLISFSIRLILPGLSISFFLPSSSLFRIQLLFEEILSNSRQMKWLSSAFMLGVVTPCSLASLSNPSATSLEHLSLLDNQLPSLLAPVELERTVHLRSLALDFCDFSSAMCRLLAGQDRAPLHRLSLLLNGAALEAKPLDGTASEDDWKALVRHSGNLRVYLMALDVCSQDLLRVLKPSMPLERIHLDSYSAPVTDGAVELISQQYHKTLSHFVLMRDDAGFPDLSINRNEDPLVLLAWRCVHLAVLIIHGEMEHSLFFRPFCSFETFQQASVECSSERMSS